MRHLSTQPVPPAVLQDEALAAPQGPLEALTAPADLAGPPPETHELDAAGRQIASIDIFGTALAEDDGTGQAASPALDAFASATATAIQAMLAKPMADSFGSFVTEVSVFAPDIQSSIIDVSYYDEPFFQEGVVGQAIQTVEAEGVTYVTAAGNDASNGYQASWSPVSGSFSLDGKTENLTDAEKFGSSPFQTLTINTEGTGDDVPLLLEWNQAYGTVSSSTADLEILVYNSSGKLVGTATNASSGESTNPWVEYDFTKSGTYYIAVENLDTGTNPGLIKEITEGDGLPATISGSNAGTVFGHAMTPGAISTGAVSVADTPAYGVNPAVGESFSSSGAGTELLFANNGTALSSPDDLSPVAVSGLDDITTTVPGGLSDFYGTSAASASLAGAAALILSADPNLTPAAVEQLMEETALPMANAAVSGAGLVQIDPAVADALAELVPAPVVSATNQTVADNQSVPLSSIFSVSGSGITEYQVWFSWPEGGDPAFGSVTDNGTPIALDQWVTVSSLSGLDFIGSGTPGTDDIWLRAYNGVWSADPQATLTDEGIPTPVVSATNQTVADNQSVPLSSIFSVSGSGITEFKSGSAGPKAAIRRLVR